jgi:stearoyl-CoA desaturase (Delta-9 desaturase)
MSAEGRDGTPQAAGRVVSERARAVGHILNLTVPLAAFVAAVCLLWNSLVGPSDLVVLALLYVVVGLGVTVGYHRLLTHRSFATYRALEWTLAVLGTMALQGSVIDWVADHRKHHAHADHEGDPHSPHTGASPLKGLWHAHAGWLFRSQGRADKRRFAPDLLDDPGMVAIDRAFPALMLASLLIPFALGYALTGALGGALTAMLWGGLVRIFLFHHATFAINSCAHFFGSRRFDTDDRSTNVAWLAPLTFGEGWHNNHHAFPRSAAHGLRWYEIDPSAAVIRLLEGFGLAWNVVRITPERQRARTLPTANVPGTPL